MEGDKLRLEDVISYTPETYFSNEELELIRVHFNGQTGQRLLKVVRKALIPSISDTDLPVEEFGKDTYMSAIDFSRLPEAEAKSTAMGLQLAQRIVLGALIQLRTIANVKEETPVNREERRKMDSSK